MTKRPEILRTIFEGRALQEYLHDTLRLGGNWRIVGGVEFNYIRLGPKPD